MNQIKTPGVYVEEVNAFPDSIVEVPTAVPVFVGYAEKAEQGTQDITGFPARITSLAAQNNLAERHLL